MITLLMVVHEREGPPVDYAYLYNDCDDDAHSCRTSVVKSNRLVSSFQRSRGKLTWMKSIPNQGVNTHGHQKESECPSKTETKGEEYWYSCW